MGTELIKPVVRIGNSAGVVLPKSWLNNRARIEIIRDSFSDIIGNVMRILGDGGVLSEVIGIYLVGSYARGDSGDDSDIDILVITNGADKRINDGKYDLLLVSLEKLEDSLKKNVLPLLPMLKEAKPILNSKLIEEYKNTELSWKNLRWHVETTKSAMKVVYGDINFSKEIDENVSRASTYSLILRLRTIYLIDCLKNNKLWKKKGLLDLIKKISGSLDAYDEYVYSKMGKNRKVKSKLKIEEAEKLMDYVNREIVVLEKWLKERKG